VNAVINRKARFEDLGLMDYQQAWDYQTRLFQQTLEVKLANRSRPPEMQAPTDNHVLFVEHPHVYTLGRNGNRTNLLITENDLEKIGATYYPINRGGDITYHGPGQIVGYPVLDLENFFTDIHRYMRSLEEAVIRTLAEYSIPAQRIDGLTGVWVSNGATPQKICALGVKTSRWVTMHGFAFNVNTNLEYFNHIVPCGIRDKSVTSMAELLGSPQDIKAVAASLRDNLAHVFGIEWTS